MVTIKQVAAHAGVSFKTVARVVNKDPTVKQANKEKVLQSINELGYRPNRAASMVRRKKSGVIGFIANDLLYVPYTFEMLRGAQQVAWDKNMELMVLNVSHDKYSLEKAIDQLFEHRAEGIIYAAMYHHEVELPDALLKTPTVLANCFCKNVLFPSVVPDEVQAAEVVTAELIKSGYKRIAFLNLSEKIVAAQGRKQGVLNAFKVHNKSLENLHIQSVVHGDEGAEVLNVREATAEVIRNFKPDAILCGQDPIALEVYFVMQEMGLKVGVDIGVASFDDWERVPSLLQPTLSTMALPHYAMGEWAINYLLDERQDHEHVKLPFTLSKRNSF